MPQARSSTGCPTRSISPRKNGSSGASVRNSPARLILPRFWTPYFDRTSRETRFGLVSGGTDALFRHAWAANLRYGTIAINHWAAVGYGLVVTPWGGFPGATPQDIKSGTGWVHNTLMFSRIQKTVVRAPFRVYPKPIWFATHRTAHLLAPKLSQFEAAPSLGKLPGILALAMRG